MDFALNDIQQMLQDSAARFIQNDYGFETRQKISKSEAGYSEDNWKLFAELGWLALPFAEQHGGLDGTPVDLMVLMNELGRGLLVEPYLATVVLGGNLIQRHGSSEQQETLLTAVIGGEMKLAFAGFEASAADDITVIGTSAEQSGDHYTITGHKPVVLNANGADRLIVAARTRGNPGDADGISLFVVDPSAEGVSCHHYPTNDGGRAADIHFDQVPGEPLGELHTASDAIQAMLNDAIIAVSAEAVGLMDKLLKATVEYCQVRKQFDVPIAHFQALQHRMVDMFMECEQARSMLYYGAIQVDKGSLEEASRAAALLKTKIGHSARLVGQEAVQLHGGMGVTDELDVGHFFKRLTMINTLFGSQDSHLNRLIKQSQAA